MLLKQCISFADIKASNKFRLWSGGTAYVKKAESLYQIISGHSMHEDTPISAVTQKNLHRRLMGYTGSTCDKIDKREILVVLEDNSTFNQSINYISIRLS